MRTLDWTDPASVALGSATAVVATPADLGLHLGGIDVTDNPGQYTALIEAATEFVEGVLGYALRERTVTADYTVADAKTPAWLRWGHPRDGSIAVSTSDGGTYSDWTVEATFRNVTLISFDDAGDYTVSYTVGPASAPAAIAKQQVLRVAASMYHGRFAERSAEWRADVRAALPHLKVEPDWS